MSDDERTPRISDAESDDDVAAPVRFADSDDSDGERTPRRNSIDSDDKPAQHIRQVDSDDNSPQSRDFDSDDETPQRREVDSDDETPQRREVDSDDEKPQRREVDSDDEQGPAKNIQVNPAFADAGQKLGLEIWRVEDFEPVRQPENTYGVFYNGDAYILLNTKVRPNSRRYDYDLHFWLGKKASQDERGAAAILAVELDEYALRGTAVQFREAQGHESKLFLSYFKKKFRYMEGGVKSGFNEVEVRTFTKRLFHVKGRKNVRIEQVECKCASLNQGDTFVLDDNARIYVWIGPKTGKKERSTGMALARAIRDEERGGRAHIHVVEDWNTNQDFFRALGSRDKAIRAANVTDDDDVVRKLDQQVLLYQVEGNENNNDKISMYEVNTRPLTQSLLNSHDCYLLDSGATGLFIWTGKGCAHEFKKRVWKGVNIFLNKRGYPDWVQVTAVMEGSESPLFKQYFKSWENPPPTPLPQQENHLAEQDYSGVNGVDIGGLHKAPAPTTEWMPDDGSGDVQVFRVDGHQLVKVSEKAHGIFFGGDSYVILYSYGRDGYEDYIIYFWQGRKSPVDERGASAAYAVAVDQKLGGDAVQIRVVMQKEPAHFLKIFGGRVVYFMNGHVKGFRNMHDHDQYDPRHAYMFQIRGDAQDNVRAMQVEARAASLNSNDIFVMDSPKNSFVWCGKFANQAETDMAKRMIAYLARQKGDPVILQEGDETLGFWNALGGEEPYSQIKKLTDLAKVIPPRLYHCSMSSGRFVVEQIIGFTQDDLDVDDVMILDAYDELFIWLGSNCKEFEKREAYKTAYQYLNTDPSGRTPDDTLIVVVRLGFEPPQFTGCFQGWDNDKWSEGKTFHELVAEVGQENAGISLLEDEVKKFTAFYTLEELQRTVPPEGVDVFQKETFLSDDDFHEVFKMSKDAYSGLPEWKRKNLKKHHRLF